MYYDITFLASAMLSYPRLLRYLDTSCCLVNNRYRLPKRLGEAMFACSVCVGNSGHAVGRLSIDLYS